MFVPMTGERHKAWCCISPAAFSVPLSRNYSVYKVI